MLADLRVEPGLLADLADHGVARVLAVVEPAAGQGPLLVGGDPGASRDSRIRSSRRITAYAATRCRRGRAMASNLGRDRATIGRAARAPAALWFSR